MVESQLSTVLGQQPIKYKGSRILSRESQNTQKKRMRELLETAIYNSYSRKYQCHNKLNQALFFVQEQLRIE